MVFYASGRDPELFLQKFFVDPKCTLQFWDLVHYQRWNTHKFISFHLKKRFTLLLILIVRNDIISVCLSVIVDGQTHQWTSLFLVIDKGKCPLCVCVGRRGGAGVFCICNSLTRFPMLKMNWRGHVTGTWCHVFFTPLLLLALCPWWRWYIIP